MKNNKVIVIGNGATGLVDSHIRRNIGDKNILLIENKKEEMDKTFEINGVKYAPRRSESKDYERTRKGSMMMSMAMAMATNYDAYGIGNSYSRKLPSNIDIVKEFELIQNKQSNLSKWERDSVIRIFNQNFKELE